MIFIYFFHLIFQQQIAAKLKGILLVNASQQDDIDQDASASNKDADYLFHQKQKSMQKTLEYEQTILKEREVRMRQIEVDVLDVNQIMNELNQFVHQQGEDIRELKIFSILVHSQSILGISIIIFVFEMLQRELRTESKIRLMMLKADNLNWKRRLNIKPNIVEKWLFC